MSAIITVGEAQGQNPTTYPCTVGSTPVNVVVSSVTIALIEDADLDTYLQARVLLLSEDSRGATDLIAPLANGSADKPNWAQQWLNGQILC